MRLYQSVDYWLGVGSLLLLVWNTSGPAYAGWVSLGDTESGTRVYVDRSTLLSKGNLVTMWILYDFRSMRTAAGKSYYPPRRKANTTVHENAMGLSWIWGFRAS